MIEFVLRVDLELGGDVHVLGTAKHLGINYITDDRLIFPSKIFVQLFGGCSHWFILPADRDLAVRYAAAQDWVSTGVHILLES